jgi:hypothetical protein
MIRKTKHPATRGERLLVKAKKKIHSNASPVYKLLKEREDAPPDPRPGDLPE